MSGWVRRRVLSLAGLVSVGALLAGCGVSSSDLPLPHASVGGPSYHVTALFRDALNLPDGAHVKLNGDDIGRVQSITLQNYTAKVAMELRDDVVLPAGTTADLRQATPLGEIFVAVHPPAHPAPGGATLHEGDVIGLAGTQTGASIEDLLSSLSLLINGGGLAQTQNITHELNTAFTGRTGQTVHLLGQTTDLLATLNANTGNIDKALAATKALTSTLDRRQDSVNKVFNDLPEQVRLFADQTDDLTHTVTSFARTGDTAGRLIDHGGGDIRAVARDLGPITDGFRDLRPILKPSLNGLVGFGSYLYQATDGDAVAANGSATLSDLLSLPAPGDPLPSATDLVNGEQGVAQSLERLYSTFGGTRATAGSPR